MYLSEESCETGDLRQGDILSNIPLLGVINLKTIQFQTDAEKKIWGWTVPRIPEFEHVVVLSHSCEIDKINDIKLTSIILSPIRDIHKATSPEKIDELKKSNIIEKDVGASYLKYFYIEPHEKMPFEDGAIVDFSKCFSVKNKSYDELLQNKILQLRPEVAEKMAFKLGLYFYRKK